MEMKSVERGREKKRRGKYKAKGKENLKNKEKEMRDKIYKGNNDINKRNKGKRKRCDIKGQKKER